MAFGPTDTIILIVVALIVLFGASKLPDIFRSLGRATGEFKKGKLESEMELAQLQQQVQQPQVQQPTSREKELENKLQELQKQLDELKKQSQNQSK